jgi:hypothetical protein
MTASLHTLLLLPLLMLSASASSQPAPPKAATSEPGMAPSGLAPSGLAHVFWSGLGQINMLFKAGGSLASGATRGAVWRLDLASGNRQRIGTADTLSWPVAATASSSVFALHGAKLVRLDADGTEAPAGGDAAWRKLLGVLPDGSVLGFAAAEPRARPALLLPDGSVQILPAPETDADRQRESFALQEERDYADGTRLRVHRSERGGQGFDIFLIKDGTQRNLTDCGNARCGQPSLTSDGSALLYIRAEP